VGLEALLLAVGDHKHCKLGGLPSLHQTDGLRGRLAAAGAAPDLHSESSDSAADLGWQLEHPACVP
jgi:hypothetical protein